MHMRDPATTPPKPRRRKLHRFGIWTVLLIGVLGLAGVMATVVLVGKPITAPMWMQTRIEARLAADLPQAQVSFEELVMVVDEGWRPRVSLRDVAVRTPAGGEIVDFREVKISMAMRPLLSGKVQPKTIALSGMVVTLQRDLEGRVALRSGRAAVPLLEAATVPQLIGHVDRLLETPALSALTGMDLQAVTLQYDDLRVDRSWTVDGGRLMVTRQGRDLTMSADLAVLSGGTGVATVTANYTSQIGETAARFGVRFDGVAAKDIAAQSPAFAWLDVLRAPISGSVRSGMDAHGLFAPLDATLQIGAGVVQPNDGTKPVPFEGAQSYFHYDPRARTLRFDTLSVATKWVSGQASGTAQLGVSDSGQLEELVGQFSLTDLRANPNDLYPEPVSLAAADVDFQLRLDPFHLHLGRVQITDQGQTLQAHGTLEADPEGWRVALDGQMDGLAPKRLLELWPQDVKPPTRKWLSENLLQADVRDIDLAVRLAPDQTPRSYVAFDYAGAEVRFMRTMPPITSGKGHFSMIDNRLVVALDEGEVIAPEGGKIRLTGSSFILPDLTVREGTPSVIRLETQSSLTAALSLLNQEPMKVMDQVGMPVDLGQGQARLQGTLAVPLKKETRTRDVIFYAEGTLEGVQSTQLVAGRSLNAPSLRVRVDNEVVSLTGAGTLDGVAFDGTWSQPLGPGADKSSLRAEITLDPPALDTLGVELPPGTLSGQSAGRLAVDFERGQAPRFALGSDLRGLRVTVPELSWVKPAAGAGRLQVSGQLGATPRIDQLEIEGAGLSAKGAVTLRDGGGLERLRLDALEVADWLSVPVDLLGQGAGQPVQVVLRGGTLDLRRAEFDSGGGGGSGAEGPPMQVALDRLQITDTIALTDVRGRFGTAAGLDGAFEARLNGGTPVRGRVVPQNGRTAVRLISEDAGGVLDAAGLLKQVVGGSLSLTLLPVGSGGAFDGRLEIGNVGIRDAPGIAALLNSISVVGLINELNGDGIYFEEVEAAFRLTPDRLTLTQASAVGASMGLSMDGIYALDSGLINMQGVITPVYLLNGIGSVLTRPGEGLIGFNYTLTGSATSPSVSVNPLSALAPGMLREIFRNPAPQVPPVEGAPQSLVTQDAPVPQNQRPDNPVAQRPEGR